MFWFDCPMVTKVLIVHGFPDFEETFKRLGKGGKGPTLWVQYYYMVDIKSFKCEGIVDQANIVLFLP